MNKIELELILKKELSPKIYYLVYKSNQKIDFEPGQFLNLEVGPRVFRPLSIAQTQSELPHELISEMAAESDPKNSFFITFLMNTKPGGPASNYFEEVECGTKLLALGPAGRFRLAANDNDKVFIATSTGLAPFIPMIQSELDEKPYANVKVFFGAWEESGLFANLFLKKYLSSEEYPNFKLYNVVENVSNGANGCFPGRVTTVVPNEIDLNSTNIDFYLCGNPAMIRDMKQILESKNIFNIYTESYGN
ncbi:MAG: ferredoxin--NADP reductase [Patescibacteria group bacterium]